jgi:capsular polysaccharide transport system permease protein
MSNAPKDHRPAGPVLRAVETVPPEADAPDRASDGASRPARAASKKPAARKIAGDKPGERQDGSPRVRPTAVPAEPAAKTAPAPARRQKAPGQTPPPQLPGPEPGIAPASASRAVGAVTARFRFRHYVAAASFLLLVLLPFAASVWYLYARAADQYHSTTAFSVRSEELAGSAAGLLGALTQVGTVSASDTDILFDYLRSQEMVTAVDARLDLRTIYNRARQGPGPEDLYFTLGDDASIEALTDAWHRMVTVDFESHAGIIRVRANAFTPEDATAIAAAVLDESSALVNRLSEQAREDAVSFARSELARVEENLKLQRARLAEFRRENRLVDPTADVAGQMGLLSALQGELAKAMVERDQLLSFVGPDDQRVVQAERRIDAIEKRIDAERGELGAAAPGSETALADVVGTYEELKVDLEFASTAYTQALAALAAARAEAGRQSRYLAAHVLPTTADRALYPHRAERAALVLLFLMIGWGILMLVYYNVRDSR